MMFYTEFDSGHLRAALRIYFIAVLTILGLIGSQCCKSAAKLDLIHGKTVKLHRMTGWMRARDVLQCLWKLKRLPGGWWLGLMMIVASILTLVADLSVALMVRQTYRHDICNFTQGLVMDWSTEDFSTPPPFGYPALIASNAQFSALSNGCNIGVYQDVPIEDDSAFCPSEREILGTWVCDDLNKDANIPPDYAVNPVDQIGEYLYNNSLQYLPDPLAYYTNAGKNLSTQYVAWSSNNTDADDRAPFDVLVSVDLNSTADEAKTMKTFYCTVASDSSNLAGINQILSQMNVVETLNQWSPRLDGTLYYGENSGTVEDPGSSLATLLNTLTMVQGGSGYVFSYYKDLHGYGCNRLKTTVSPGVFILVGFAALILFITAFYWLYLIMRLGKHALPDWFHRHHTGIRGLKPVPDSVLSWMLQASRENALAGGSGEMYEGAYLAGVPRKERDLQGWSFTVTDAENGVAKMTREARSAALPMGQVYVTVNQK